MNKKLAAAILLTSASLTVHAQLYDVSRVFTSLSLEDTRGESLGSRISPDGKYAVFSSTRTNLRRSDMVNTSDCYVYSFAEPPNRMVANKDRDGRIIPLANHFPRERRMFLSDRSEWTVFNSIAPTLTPTGVHRGVFAFNRVQNAIQAVPVLHNGQPIENAKPVAFAGDGSHLLISARIGSRDDLYLSDLVRPVVQISDSVSTDTLRSAAISPKGTSAIWSSGSVPFVVSEFGNRLFVRTNGVTRECFQGDEYGYIPIWVSDDGTIAVVNTDRPFDPLDTDRQSELYLVNLTTDSGRRINSPNRSTDSRFTSISSSGKWIVTSLGGRVARINVLDGTLTEIAPLEPISQTIGEVSISDDGTKIVVGLWGSQPYQVTEVFLLDAKTRGLRRLDSGAEKASLAGDIPSAQVSTDGRVIAFRYDGSDLIAGVSGPGIYWKNLQSKYLQRLPIDVKYDLAPLAISETGRYILFPEFRYDVKRHQILRVPTGKIAVAMDGSGDRILLTEPGFGLSQIYLMFVQSGQMVTVSRTKTNAVANGRCAYASISADGTTVAFVSSATNLPGGRQPLPWTEGVPSDYTSLYLYNVAKGVPRLQPIPVDVTYGGVMQSRLSADGSKVGYVLIESNASYFYHPYCLTLASRRFMSLGSYSDYPYYFALSPDGDHGFVRVEFDYNSYLYQTRDGASLPVLIDSNESNATISVFFLNQKRRIILLRFGELLNARFKFRGEAP